MKLHLLMEGPAFTLYAIRMGDDVVDYLEELESRNAQAHAQIVRRLEQLAERGPSRKKDEFNLLGDGLYEVKARSGPRIIFFYDRNQIVICSSAFDKGGRKTPKKELRTARDRRREYEECKRIGNGFTISMAEGQPPPTRQP